ncbi:APOBEC4: Apolipoprotein B mRNA editing enzyme catalytic polypeptide like 4 [Crotalus adamanteus]|uniref:APOBEC4: Apolipoprotein B mRNA editing enzyme catalytic polypeptide like 4 n=1 Tax=Crotalus adamanteus TaxID=8729 RepID=A0AAW1BPM9_CROAD
MMDLETKPFCQEYLAQRGTIVKPYYWLTMSQNCTKCPYHIQTGEEARVPYTEFQNAFGFPYGPMDYQNKHLLFYELRHVSGKLIQKGQVTNCVEYNIHPESMLFEMDGYLDSVVHNWGNVAYIILYSNYSPCNEAEHECISKMYSFLMKHPDITLCIYFSQLYHTEEDFPVSTWNCEALQSLASMWPQVTLNPLCGGLWHSLLYNFVCPRPQARFYHPILPIRTLADKKNATQIRSVTGMKLPFVNTLSLPVYGTSAAAPSLQNYYLSNSNYPAEVTSKRMPPMEMPPFHFTPPLNTLPPLYKKPRNIVRHLNMPNESLSKLMPKERSLHRGENIIEQLLNKSAELEGYRKKKDYIHVI